MNEIKNNHIPTVLHRVAADAQRFTEQTKTYQNQTGRAAQNHFAEVVHGGRSKAVTFRTADEQTFDVVLESEKDTAHLYIGNRMQYTVYVERLRGFDVVQQVLPIIRQQLPKELAKGFRVR